MCIIFLRIEVQGTQTASCDRHMCSLARTSSQRERATKASTDLIRKTEVKALAAELSGRICFHSILISEIVLQRKSVANRLRFKLAKWLTGSVSDLYSKVATK